MSCTCVALLAGCTGGNRNKAGNDQDERYQPKPDVELKHPDWSKNATIYEVNIRQYKTLGTFKVFGAHLPRLKTWN